MSYKSEAFRVSRRQLEQRFERRCVLTERQQSALEFEQQHWLPLRSGPVSFSLKVKACQEQRAKGMYFPTKKLKTIAYVQCREIRNVCKLLDWPLLVLIS